MCAKRSAPHESQLYHGLSCVYDVVFSPLLTPGIHSTVRGLRIPPGARILEVGVGTGISLSAYPEHAHVVAIDYSPRMLERASQLVRRRNWRHIELRQMNALDLEFPDSSFDYVMAFHILSVVPNSQQLLQEMSRVTKGGGTIAIINHLRTESRIGGKFLNLVDPITRRLGWQTKLSYSDVVGDAPLKVVRRFKSSPASPFTVIIARQTQTRVPSLPAMSGYSVASQHAAN